MLQNRKVGEVLEWLRDRNRIKKEINKKKRGMDIKEQICAIEGLIEGKKCIALIV